ncbi:sensor histidine kinase [Prauserella muralis]|uniref:histidine kinase n=1 Tax=Prauserella muralis TaxID=588067 RepID=A0A2V4ANY1_9PSEU|nr:HAMP domain-containing sensor histidine kinase [Prauserella muralis]PXY22406.1 two-component sensor histidine kinase [Prauserella muralis]TWE28069.1 signal transduction histidine kinase [Prauserella muralis]
MRTRLSLVLAGFALAAVAAFAAPLLASTAAERTQQLLIGRDGDIDRFVVLAQQAVDSGDASALAAEARRYAELYGEGVLVVDARRRPLAEAGLSVRDAGVPALVEGALRNQPGPRPATLTPWSSGSVLLARPVGTGTRVAGAVVLRASVEAAAADVGRSWAAITAGALAAAVGFVLLALLLARWVVRPLHALERGVRAVSAGRRAEVPAEAGPKELRSLAVSVNRMSDAVAESAEQQRRLVADASHQLRNPLAALRLRVDSLAPAVRDEGRRAYEATVGEVERLESLADGLLALAVAESTATRLAAGGERAEPCDVRGVIADRVDAWQPSAELAGVRLVHPGGGPLPAGVPEPDVAQVLDVVLDNAIHYAGDGATVTLRATREDGRVRLVVADDGPGLDAEGLARATERFWRAGGEAAPRGTGLGLAIASSLLTARDGGLELRPVTPHGLAVHLLLPGAHP